MSFIPPRPTGSSPEAAFDKAVWDRLFGAESRFVDSPTVKWNPTTRGLSAEARSALAGGAKVNIKMFEFVNDQTDYINCLNIPDDGNIIQVGKPYKLRWSITTAIIGGTVVTYTYDPISRARTALNNSTGETEVQIVIPAWLSAQDVGGVHYPGDTIYAIQLPAAEAPGIDHYLDLNVDGRAWARRTVQAS